MKSKPLNIVFALLMIGALVGGLFLVRQKQETRRGAYFAGTKMLIMPEKISGNVGGEVIAQLFVDTEKGAKLSSIDTQICYGNELMIGEDDPSSQVVLNKEALGTLVDASVVGERYKCLRLVAIAALNVKPENLKEGMVRVATIKFIAAVAGSGEIKIDGAKTKVGGYNPTPGATDSALKVGDIQNAKYVIEGEVIYCDDRKCPPGYECYQPPMPTCPAGNVCPQVMPRPYCRKIVPTITPTPAVRSCNQSCGVNSNCKAGLICFPQWWPCLREMPAEILSKTQVAGGSLSTEEQNVLIGICPEVEGKIPDMMPPFLYGVCRNPQCPFKPDCQCQASGDSVLNYKVAFANVNGNDAKCVVDWPIQIIVLGGGKTAVYPGVIPQEKEVVDGKLIFSGSLELTGFQKREGVAVFAKGPKHLQVKYGKNNQEGPYNQAGGEITLTASADTSPVYDFFKYPMIAGDVVGVNSETPDGWINGVDFSYVKSKSLVHETTNSGGYLRGDLDGNCQVNSNDVNILKISLQEKQGQLY
ncbi:MAG: hypothetical protein AAB574_02980 [Patescibacteria group bacterium]